jgi:predicted dinucleotide-binding enzyme
MRIGVVGSGRIGGNAARLFGSAGHDVFLSFSRDPDRLQELAATIGDRAQAGQVSDAVAFADVVLLSVGWALVPAALAEAGSLEGKVVIDTTNQFGPGGVEPIPDGLTAAQFNQRRMPGARLAKAFNTVTAGFQASEAGRPADRRAVLFYCGDDPDAKQAASSLIEDAGFAPADLGGLADAGPMEAPRRAGALYGEEYRADDASAAIAALRAGRPLPPTPRYND